jgi:hypothetical protein
LLFVIWESLYSLLLSSIYLSLYLLGPWRQAFDLLVEATNAVGWDRILEIRAGVFLMREDVEREALQRAQQQAEVSLKIFIFFSHFFVFFSCFPFSFDCFALSFV